MINVDRTREYLMKPWSKATLADHARYDQQERELSSVEADVRSFLGVEFAEMTMHTEFIAPYDVPHVFHAIAACVPQWRCVGEAGGVHRLRSKISSRQLFETSPGDFNEYLTDGVRLYELPGGQRRVLYIERAASRRGDGYDWHLIGRREDDPEFTADFNLLLTWMDTHHYLKGQALRPDGTLLPIGRQCTWEDIALMPGVQEMIQSNTIDLIRLHEQFARNGIPLKRGILLYGPPGVGKTLVGKILARVPGITFIYATAAHAEVLSELQQMFDLARRFKPTILFLEDLDLFAFGRKSRGSAGPLGEILAQLDGIEENDGLICVATTNDLEAIEPALKDRPSRFDVVLEIGLPTEAVRRRILELNLKACPNKCQLLDDLASATDGMTGAQVREVAYVLIQGAILRGSLNDEGMARPAWQDADAAIERIQLRKRQVVGFRDMPKPHSRSNILVTHP